MRKVLFRQQAATLDAALRLARQEEALEAACSPSGVIFGLLRFEPRPLWKPKPLLTGVSADPLSLVGPMASSVALPPP
ncbi:unnamed protein product [Dibothriocephalus latus]|uniref:Uncharacterized protein n=1 Tax=Dibothriocephalus latus TaxID=60516 RepID=A0A3P7MQ41_DIBLA|nr:unnamed protein product [Dibothriocephalus latus]